MPFARCYFHVVWATKRRAAIITPAISECIINSIKEKSAALRSPIFAIYAMPDHLHVAVSLSTHLAISEWVRQVKGFSTHEVNTMYPNLETSFGWQKSYGALTFGTTAREFVCGYINRQREHHADQKTYAWMERIDEAAHEHDE